MRATRGEVHSCLASAESPATRVFRAPLILRQNYTFSLLLFHVVLFLVDLFCFLFCFSSSSSLTTERCYRNKIKNKKTCFRYKISALGV